MSQKTTEVIIAGPGCGKTHTLTNRVIEVINGLSEDAKIVVFTFTKKAAKELKDRITKKLSIPIENKSFNKWFNFEKNSKKINMFIGTIDGYCFKILKENEQEFTDIEMLDENKEIMFILARGDDNEDKDNVKLSLGIHEGGLSTLYKNKVPYSLLAQQFKATVDLIYDEHISIESLKDQKSEIFKKYFNNYQKKLRAWNYTTFSYLMYKASNFLKSINDKSKFHPDYLFVDEFQDINKAQWEIIKSLSKYSKLLLVVGDPRQTIYQWRGSKDKFLIDLYTESNKKDFSNNQIITNHRSSKIIVDLSNEFCNKFLSDEIKYEDLKPIKEYKNTLIELIKYPCIKIEAEKIAQKIKSLKDRGLIDSYNDVAILLRSVKRNGDFFIKALKENGIEYVIGGRVGLFKRAEIKLAVLQLYEEFLKHIEKDDGLLQLIKKEVDILKQELGNNISGKLKIEIEENSIKNIMITDSVNVETEERKNLEKFIQMINDFVKIKTYRKKTELKTLIKGIYWFIETYAKDMYGEWNPDDLEDNISKNEEETKKEDKEAVKIYTVHQAKGLEWKVVFLPCLNEGEFPIKNYIGNFLSLDEFRDLYSEYSNQNRKGETNLFYVAITRAKEMLFLSYSEEKSKYIKELSLEEKNDDFLFIETEKAISFNKDSNVKSELKEKIKKFLGESQKKQKGSRKLYTAFIGNRENKDIDNLLLYNFSISSSFSELILELKEENEGSKYYYDTNINSFVIHRDKIKKQGDLYFEYKLPKNCNNGYEIWYYARKEIINIGSHISNNLGNDFKIILDIEFNGQSEMNYEKEKENNIKSIIDSTVLALCYEVKDGRLEYLDNLKKSLSKVEENLKVEDLEKIIRKKILIPKKNLFSKSKDCRKLPPDDLLIGFRFKCNNNNENEGGSKIFVKVYFVDGESSSNVHKVEFNRDEINNFKKVSKENIDGWNIEEIMKHFEETNPWYYNPDPASMKLHKAGCKWLDSSKSNLQKWEKIEFKEVLEQLLRKKVTFCQYCLKSVKK